MSLQCYRCNSPLVNNACACNDGIAIVHGDSDELLPEIEAGTVAMIWTDPPYGHNNNNGDLIHKREAALGKKLPHGPSPAEPRPIANDEPEDASRLVKLLFNESRRLLVPGGCCCCCCGGGGGPDPQFARWALWMDEQLDFKQMIVWDKGPIGMGWHYRRSYEVILVGMRPGAKCKWHTESSNIENIIRPTHGWAPKIIPQETDHPTAKPVGLAAFFIDLHSERGELVLDPFVGAGTALRAAKNLGRRAIGIELEEKYCEMAANRLRKEVLF